MRAATLSASLAKRGLSVTVPLTAFLAGCTGAVSSASGGPSIDAETSVTHAVVLLERTVDVAPEGARAAASARFARVAAGASQGDTLRAIGAALDLPAPGSCASIRPVDGALGSADPVPVVELLDVGRVSVEASGAVTPLVPRQLPYVTDVVTGTVYARAAEAALLPPGAAYAVHVAGTRDFAAFDVTAVAPDDPTDVAILQEGPAGKVVATGATLDFSWTAATSATAPAQAGAPGTRAAAGIVDQLYVEVQPAGLRCALGGGSANAGVDGLVHASIPAGVLGSEAHSGTLVVHRLHAEPLQVRGIDDGELRFDFARVVTYARP